MTVAILVIDDQPDVVELDTDDTVGLMDIRMPDMSGNDLMPSSKCGDPT